MLHTPVISFKPVPLDGVAHLQVLPRFRKATMVACPPPADVAVGAMRRYKVCQMAWLSC